MKIYIASDHAGFSLKERLTPFLKEELGHEVFDKGPFVYNTNDDYSDFIPLVAKEVAERPDIVKGIIIGGSGQGEAMAANRFKGVRAAVYYMTHLEILTLSRTHNDANILSIGARFINEDDAKNAVKLWLETSFLKEERHVRRLKKLDEFS